MSVELKSTIAKQRKEVVKKYLQAQQTIAILTIELRGIKKVNKSRKIVAFIAHTILGLCLISIGIGIGSQL